MRSDRCDRLGPFALPALGFFGGAVAGRVFGLRRLLRGTMAAVALGGMTAAGCRKMLRGSELGLGGCTTKQPVQSVGAWRRKGPRPDASRSMKSAADQTMGESRPSSMLQVLPDFACPGSRGRSTFVQGKVRPFLLAREADRPIVRANSGRLRESTCADRDLRWPKVQTARTVESEKWCWPTRGASTPPLF
jgi:hypothetical protein